MSEQILFEVYALSDLREALRKVNDEIQVFLHEAGQAIRSEESRLRQIEQKRTQEAVRCRAAYERCRSYRDEDGYPPPCTAELYVLEKAEQALQEVRDQINHFSDQTDTYRYKETQFQQNMETNIADARAFLNTRIQEGTKYLETFAATLSDAEAERFLRQVPGTGTHGSRYRRARQAYFEQVAGGEHSNVPRYLQGWARQEVNRGSNYYRSPFGRYRGNSELGISRGTTTSYEVGHRIAMLDIPENLYFQGWDLNRNRAIIARRMGISRIRW
ncbi:MAG TPA: hypothetical protein EYH05_06765 [Anaerolineae bacterium]|nr:hypothetical protein [Anaerolineae bacterium]